MRIEQQIGGTLPVHKAPSPTAASANPFLESSLKSAVDSKKPGLASTAISFIFSIPVMIIRGTWTLLKYTIYFATIGTCCKPSYDLAKLKAGLEEVVKADDKKAVWEKFKKNYPRALDQLIELGIANKREQELRGKKAKDPEEIRKWNEKFHDAKYEVIKAQYENQDGTLLKGVIKALEARIAGS